MTSLRVMLSMGLHGLSGLTAFSRSGKICLCKLNSQQQLGQPFLMVSTRF
jgi:hypothetical protein